MRLSSQRGWLGKKGVESMGDPMARGSGAYLKETVTYYVRSLVLLFRETIII